MPLTTGAGFDYGNARLRARKASLLGRADYEELLGKSLDGVLGALSDTSYGPDLEQAAGRLSDLSALHQGVRNHLARSLEQMRSFYRDRARVVVDVLLSRWDLHNLLALLRGQATGQGTDETMAGIVPIGKLDEAAAAEVARQSDLGRAVELLRGWRLPSVGMARAVVRAWPAYLRTEDLAALEQALTVDHFRHARAALGELGGQAQPLERELSREADVRNVLVALRLCQATDAARGEPPKPGEPFVPGGRIRNERLLAARASGEAREAASALADAAPEPGLREALERWAPEDGVFALQAELEARRTRATLRLFVSGDPLGAAVPLAFTVAKTTEARNLRLLGDGAARGVAPADLRPRLLLAEEHPR